LTHSVLLAKSICLLNLFICTGNHISECKIYRSLENRSPKLTVKVTQDHQVCSRVTVWLKITNFPQPKWILNHQSTGSDNNSGVQQHRNRQTDRQTDSNHWRTLWACLSWLSSSEQRISLSDSCACSDCTSSTKQRFFVLHSRRLSLDTKTLDHDARKPD